MNKGGFSWKTLFGITQLKRRISRKTGIPMSKTGMEAKIGRAVINLFFGRKRKLLICKREKCIT